MNIEHQNFTIIVNWKKKGFGCTKVCSYCNWRESPFLPHGIQDSGAITQFIRQVKKDFITISGGADPLYKFPEYADQLLSLVQQIKNQGLRVRIITREVEHVAALRGLVNYVSISLDSEVLETIPAYQHLWAGMDIEYSLVLPPIPTSEIAALKPQYEALRRRLNGRLVLRENLNSIYALDFAALSFGHSGISFVPKSVCLNGRYLSNIDSTGHELIQNNERLAEHLMSNPNVFLFGGFVRHLISPSVHMEYDDIDVIALSADVMVDLSSRFSFDFKATSPTNSYPRYFQGRPRTAGKAIQLVLMHSASDALQFIHNSQYDTDRVGYSDNAFYFDPKIGRESTVNAIKSKRARRIFLPRAMNLFHHKRDLIEQKHRVKLLRKGFTVHD